MGTSLTGDAFGRLLATFERSAFRLETLDVYEIEGDQERLEAFLAGRPQPESPAKQAWVRTISAAVASGKTMRRVHVVSEPLTDYLRFELLVGYPPNVEAGEEIFIRSIDPGRWPAELPRHDFWLFDGARVARMHYDPGGRYLGAELVEDPDEVARYRLAEQAAYRGAIPLTDYLSSRLPTRQAS